MNVKDLLQALSSADPAGPVMLDVDHQQRPIDAVVMTGASGATFLLADPAEAEPAFENN